MAHLLWARSRAFGSACTLKSLEFSMTRPNVKRLIFTRFEVILGIMACLSLLLVLAPRDWLKKSYEMSPTDYPLSLLDDAYSGGNSTAMWVNKDQTHWRCELGERFRNPYCSMQISLLNQDGVGIDLDGFNVMKVWLTYRGDGRHVRLYLRNRHSAYFKPGDDSTTKYNLVEIPTDDLEPGFDIDMKDIGVADWWLASKNVSLEFSAADFNDVIFIEVQTGSTSLDGHHEMKLDKIVWEGVLITDEQFFRGLVITWSVLIFALLIFRLLLLRVELGRNRRYQDELISINRLLNLQNKQFEDLAKTDQLTGLLNRIGIRDALYDGLNDWKARRRPFSFVMIDIDHFKSVNDNHGHDVGDAILKGAAELFKTNVRHTDFLARWGGEEFILVCPDTDLGQAQVVAESLRKKLEEAEIYEELKVTASFGVATLTQPSLDHLFKCADEALYDAKNQGRNRVVAKL